MLADVLRLDDLYSNLFSVDLVALWLLLLSFWALGTIFFTLTFLTAVAIIVFVYLLISYFIILLYVLEFLLPLILSYDNRLILLFLPLLLYHSVILVLRKQFLGLIFFNGKVDMLLDLLGVKYGKFLFAKYFAEWLSTCFLRTLSFPVSFWSAPLILASLS